MKDVDPKLVNEGKFLMKEKKKPVGCKYNLEKGFFFVLITYISMYI